MWVCSSWILLFFHQRAVATGFLTFIEDVNLVFLPVSHQASGQETRSWLWAGPPCQDWTWTWCRVSSATRSSSCCWGETSRPTPRGPTPGTPASPRPLRTSRPGPPVREALIQFSKHECVFEVTFLTLNWISSIQVTAPKTQNNVVIQQYRWHLGGV